MFNRFWLKLQMLRGGPTGCESQRGLGVPWCCP